MANFTLSDRLAAVFEVMNLMHTQMFLVLVEEDGGFRFGGINRAHATATGLTNEALAGKAPGEILPPRIAETVTANYERCVRMATPASICADCRTSANCVSCVTGFEYEEHLELPSGPRWWKTHLSPVGRGGRVIALIGHSYDITEEKARVEGLTGRFDRVNRSADDLRAMSRASFNHLRGPLQQILSFTEMLRPEFKPPMDRKIHFLNGIREATREALAELDGYDAEAGNILMVEGMPSEVDLGHLCRDIAALVDPGRNLNIRFPDATLFADREAVRWTLHKTMEMLGPVVASEIAVTLAPDGLRARAVKLSVACDLIDPGKSGLSLAQLQMLIAGGEVRGILTDVEDRALSGGRRGLKLGFSFAGRIGRMERHEGGAH